MDWMMKVYHRLRIGQPALAGGSCVLCTAVIPADAGICGECRGLLPATGHQCARCAAALPETADAGSLCGQCLRSTPAFDAVFAPYRYAAPLDRLVIDLKYNGALHLARTLGQLIAAAAQESGRPVPDAFVPVPLHRRRLRDRGYNQSMEIARFLGRETGIPVAPGIARRVRDTLPQTTLSESRRAQNVRRAFRVESSVEGMRLAIVDDVMTTGHTVNALASALRKRGAASIEVWLAGRA
jgi:ComF family protein